jgi:hypothetical protein
MVGDLEAMISFSQGGAELRVTAVEREHERKNALAD